MTSEEIKKRIAKASDKINMIENLIEDFLRNKKVRIISDWNGSKFAGKGPDLKGSEFVVKAVKVSGSSCEIWDGLYHHDFIDIEKVEFI